MVEMPAGYRACCESGPAGLRLTRLAQRAGCCPIRTLADRRDCATVAQQTLAFRMMSLCAASVRRMLLEMENVHG
jgi:hypothetical protein